jgi:tyrosyl-tRNA synthetase
MKTMSSLIKHIVREALQSGQLTAKAEAQIQRLFQRGCDMEDIEALTQLQLAVEAGAVKRVLDSRGNFLFGDR